GACSSRPTASAARAASATSAGEMRRPFCRKRPANSAIRASIEEEGSAKRYRPPHLLSAFATGAVREGHARAPRGSPSARASSNGGRQLRLLVPFPGRHAPGDGAVAPDPVLVFAPSVSLPLPP